jgi:hypothetical protein
MPGLLVSSFTESLAALRPLYIASSSAASVDRSNGLVAGSERALGLLSAVCAVWAMWAAGVLPGEPGPPTATTQTAAARAAAAAGSHRSWSFRLIALLLALQIVCLLCSFPMK